ncbi:hypothetical protein CK231_01320 [Mesorhizobium loti]|nr:hypothetical protein CK231_01320 [Mesorhizobium loti]PBB49881.1 hypothetical protein CK213_06445 [Mesorhizobium loti]
MVGGALRARAAGFAPPSIMSTHKPLCNSPTQFQLNEARPVRLEDSLGEVRHFQTLAHLSIKSLLGSWGAI